jgi:hypothetical protein
MAVGDSCEFLPKILYLTPCLLTAAKDRAIADLALSPTPLMHKAFEYLSDHEKKSKSLSPQYLS